MVELLTRITSRRRHEVEPFSAENLPTLLDDARTYVAHGNNTWGNSISYDVRGDHELSVYGWLARAPFPRTGDKLLTKMASDKWGVYVFGEVRICGDPHDMFMASAFGAIDYAEQEPQTKRCDEFFENLPAFFSR